MCGRYYRIPDTNRLFQGQRSTFNARAEGLERSSLWNRPLNRHRCIVPISGYYEWQKPERTAFRFDLGQA